MHFEEQTLVKRKRVTFKKTKTLNLGKIYINTLVPYFEFKNQFGKMIRPKDCCITL